MASPPVSPALVAAGALGAVGLHNWQDAAAAAAVALATFTGLRWFGKRVIVNPIKNEIATQTTANNALLRREIRVNQEKMRNEIDARHLDNKRYIDAKVFEITNLVKASTQSLKDQQ